MPLTRSHRELDTRRCIGLSLVFRRRFTLSARLQTYGGEAKPSPPASISRERNLEGTEWSKPGLTLAVAGLANKCAWATAHTGFVTPTTLRTYLSLCNKAT